MSKSPVVEEYLANLPPNLQGITRELVVVARKNMPRAYEFIYHDAVDYFVTESPFDRVFTLKSLISSYRSAKSEFVCVQRPSLKRF